MSHKCQHPLNFFDPPSISKEGEPYSKVRYRDIVKERYYIAKHGNIPYSDSAKMTPAERELIMHFILDDLQTQQNIINQQLAKTNN